MSDSSRLEEDDTPARHGADSSIAMPLPRDDETRVSERQEQQETSEAGNIAVAERSASQPATPPTTNSSSSTPLSPRPDSASSFVTARDSTAVTLLFSANTNNNSNIHTTSATSSHGSTREAMGSLSMARIAEEPSSLTASSPPVTRPSTGPHREGGEGGEVEHAGGNTLDGETTEVLASTSNTSPSPTMQSPRAVSARLSSSSLASSSGSSRSKRKTTGGGAAIVNGPSSTTRSLSDKSASRDSLHPTASPSLPLISPPTPSSSRSPRILQHSTLASSANEEQQEQQHQNNNTSTRSIHSLSSQHSPSTIPSTASPPPPPSNGESTTASSSTPRLNAASVPASNTAMMSSYSRSSLAGGESHSHLSNNHNNKEVFKIPITSSPSASPILPPVNGAPAYPQSHSSPNFQPSSQLLPQYIQDRDNNNAAGIGTGEAALRAGAAPARYSHAGFPISATHPPVTASSHHGAALHSQRSSVPILAPSLPPNAYGQQTSSSNINDPRPVSDISFVPPPVNRLSDAGFGSSSPYPPIGAQQQQRYSLPVQTSTAIPTFTQPFPSYQGSTAMSPAASLRPQPTTSYNAPGQSKHLPEMHPSALEARPSISAPFPPSSSPPRGATKGLNNIAAPAAIQQRERPDTSRPLGQEICLECLMRDRDMADVEVTGPGVWSRNSDIDFEEALRAEEIAIATAAQHAAATGTNGGHTGSSAEDGNELDRRSYALHRNGSTEENYGIPIQQQNGRYVTARDGGPIRSPSRESSVSDGQRGYRRQIQHPRRRLGSHDPLTSASLKLWTQMNHVSSAHRYKVLSDFVQEQTRHLEQERRAYEQSVQDRDRADRAMRDSPAKMSLDARSSMSSNLIAPGGAVSPKLLDLRRGSKGRAPSMQLLPNGMTVETIDVQWDEKEAKARAKAANKSRRGSANSPSDNNQRKSFAPSVKSFNALSTYNSRQDTLPSPTGSFAPPWMADERRRFSSPMLSSKYRNASSDNLARNKHYIENEQEMRKSSYSMMSPPLRAMRSPSPSRQSFQTGTSQRESRGWRRSLWPRSASASVASFPRSGSMMEMHLGMSQDKHEPMPSGYQPHDLHNLNGPGMHHAPGGTWPDNASELGEQGGISPDENVEAAKTKKQKKKRFQKLFNSLLGTHHHSSEKAVEKRGREGGMHGDQYASHAQINGEQQENGQQRPQHQSQRRQASFNYAAAAYQDDYSEPLAPPPPLSYLTGQQPHSRSYSSSSQSSVTAPSPAMQQQHPDTNASYQINTRPNSLTVPRNNTNSSNGFVSPSTSSSDLNRNRPSSVTSWRSSSNKTTGSPQSPRELLAESFGHPMPAIRQASFEELAPGLRGFVGVEMVSKDPHAVDPYKLRREKSLPALPPGEYDGIHPPMPGQPDYALQQHLPNIHYDQAQFPRVSSYGAPPVQPIGPAMHEIYGMPDDQYASQYHGTGSEWTYGPQTREGDYDGANSIGKGSKKPKMRSRLFSFGNKKSRSSTSPPPVLQSTSPHSGNQAAAYSPKGFAPHETALQAVVRDQNDMVAYRYPSTTTHA